MAEASNVLRVNPDGPIVVTGEIAVLTPTGVRDMKTAVLCRCGHSADKPFCDGAHVKRGFADSARLPAAADSVSEGSGKLTVTPLSNGPNRCEGPLSVRDVDGRTAASTSTLLCRCGGSQTKPFCDGTHEKNRFRD